MDLPVARVGRRLRLLAVGMAAAAVAVVPAAAATAAPVAADAPGTVAAASHPDSYGANQLNISMQVQQQNQWCWVASGDTIAAYHGHGVSQNAFCDMARGYPTGSSCPNQAGYLSWDQRAFQQLGISPGSETGALSYNTIVSEIDGNRPILTGISWTSGGGHAEVIYGYSNQQIYFGDPWPSDQRYNLMQYSQYRSNYQFTWNDSLYRIGA